MFVFVFCAGASGCATPTRVANHAWVAGGRVVSADATESASGAFGGVAISGNVAETDEDWLTGWARGDLFIGGNPDGVAGQGTLALELGGAFFDGEHHLLARGGFSASAERNPYDGLFLVEVPKATLGYQFHGEGTSGTGSMHVDVGATGGLAAVGRSFAAADTSDVVGAPEVGAAAIFMWELFSANVLYDRVFEAEGVDVIRANGCFLPIVGVCVDVRYVLASFEGVRRTPNYVGVTFGFGFASGLERNFSF